MDDGEQLTIYIRLYRVLSCIQDLREKSVISSIRFRLPCFSPILSEWTWINTNNVQNVKRMKLKAILDSKTLPRLASQLLLSDCLYSPDLVDETSVTNTPVRYWPNKWIALWLPGSGSMEGWIALNMCAFDSTVTLDYSSSRSTLADFSVGQVFSSFPAKALKGILHALYIACR